MDTFRMLEKPRPSADLGPWDRLAGPFRDVVGFTLFGDFFLRDPASGQVAILYTIPPELMPTTFHDVEEFARDMLADEEIIEELLRPEDVEELAERLGPPGPEEVFIPEPYPFLGGSGDLETYSKGSVWGFARVVGEMQGVGEAGGGAG